MGLSKSKTKTVQKNDPWAPAQPYILKGLEQSGRVFDSQQGQLEDYAKAQRDAYGRISAGAERGILRSQDLNNKTLGGNFLTGNPYLDKILDQSRMATTDAVNGQFESSGRYGGGMHAAILAREIAKQEDQARYANYATERQNQIHAMDTAQQLMGGSQSLLNNAAELPWIGVGALNGNVRQASNGYGTSTSTQTSTPSWGQMLASAAASAAQAYAASDRRLKTRIEEIGLWDGKDGLKKYRFAYKHSPDVLIEGVMADEVKELRPEAYVPNFNNSGFAGVNYGAL